MRIVVTGADGFLGWHLRTRLRAYTDHCVVPISRKNWESLAAALASADAVIHLAGVNRAVNEELLNTNRQLAEEVVQAAEAVKARPRLLYANSIHAEASTPYGRGKAAASQVLRSASLRWGTPYVNLVLPNLFGEHAAPGYNSFVATFIDAILSDKRPDIADRNIALLHAQEAAQLFIDGLDGPSRLMRPEGTRTSVRDVWNYLVTHHAAYSGGDFPALPSEFQVNLFNTYRAALFPAYSPKALPLNSDARGWLIETARWLGSQGQTFVSTTKPGEVRGEHYHLRKIERFVVLAGSAKLSLRRVCTDEVIYYSVEGDKPVAVDMPIGWVHNIKNVGSTDLVTQFWVNEVFDPKDPDTFRETVQLEKDTP